VWTGALGIIDGEGATTHVDVAVDKVKDDN